MVLLLPHCMSMRRRGAMPASGMACHGKGVLAARYAAGATYGAVQSRISSIRNAPEQTVFDTLGSRLSPIQAGLVFYSMVILLVLHGLLTPVYSYGDE